MATDPHAIIASARGWIGTPYVHQASLKGVGCDCLGRLRGVWREVIGEEPEDLPPYSPDWAEATGKESMYEAFSRHLIERQVPEIAPGMILVFRMVRHCPAKHCGIVGEKDGVLTLIHSRQNKQVNEEAFSVAWRRLVAYVFEVP